MVGLVMGLEGGSRLQRFRGRLRSEYFRQLIEGCWALMDVPENLREHVCKMDKGSEGLFEGVNGRFCTVDVLGGGSGKGKEKRAAWKERVGDRT